MVSFRGKPTVFGDPACNDDGECSYTVVNQYDPLSDSWSNIGKLDSSRRFHTIIEMPPSTCDHFNIPTTTPDPGTTDPPPTTSQPPVEDTVALIIGGDALETTHFSAELFGCPSQAIKEISPFPYGVNYAGSAYLGDTDEAMVCGGSACTGPLNCQVTDACYAYDWRNDGWTSKPTLLGSKQNFIIGEVPNLDDPDRKMVPIAMGGSRTTEILVNNKWERYYDLPSPWYATTCFLQHGDLIYHLG